MGRRLRSSGNVIRPSTSGQQPARTATSRELSYLPPLSLLYSRLTAQATESVTAGMTAPWARSQSRWRVTRR